MDVPVRWWNQEKEVAEEGTEEGAMIRSDFRGFSAIPETSGVVYAQTGFGLSLYDLAWRVKEAIKSASGQQFFVVQSYRDLSTDRMVVQLKIWVDKSTGKWISGFIAGNRDIYATLLRSFGHSVIGEGTLQLYDEAEIVSPVSTSVDVEAQKTLNKAALDALFLQLKTLIGWDNVQSAPRSSDAGVYFDSVLKQYMPTPEQLASSDPAVVADVAAKLAAAKRAQELWITIKSPAVRDSILSQIRLISEHYALPITENLSLMTIGQLSSFLSAIDARAKTINSILAGINARVADFVARMRLKIVGMVSSELLWRFDNEDAPVFNNAFVNSRSQYLSTGKINDFSVLVGNVLVTSEKFFRQGLGDGKTCGRLAWLTSSDDPTVWLSNNKSRISVTGDWSRSICQYIDTGLPKQPGDGSDGGETPPPEAPPPSSGGGALLSIAAVVAAFLAFKD